MHKFFLAFLTFHKDAIIIDFSRLSWEICSGIQQPKGHQTELVLCMVPSRELYLHDASSPSWGELLVLESALGMQLEASPSYCLLSIMCSPQPSCVADTVPLPHSDGIGNFHVPYGLFSHPSFFPPKKKMVFCQARFPLALGYSGP